VPVDYLHATMAKLFSSGVDAYDYIAIVHLADFDDAWVKSTAEKLQDNWRGQVADGRLHALHAPARLYPNLNICPPTALSCIGGESSQRASWRAKRQIDYAMLMAYSAEKSRYYIQLEDDISFTSGWLSTVFEYIDALPNATKESNSPWRMVDLKGAGCLGKMFQSNELLRLATYFLLFYDQLHCEGAVAKWTKAMTSGKGEQYFKKGKVLFNHEGLVGSHGRSQPEQVTCGGHSAPSCAECPMDQGESYCHGDCVWIMESCVLNNQEALVAASHSPADPTHDQSPFHGSDHDHESKGTLAQASEQHSETFFGSSEHVNPQIELISTSMTVVPTFSVHFAYVEGTRTAHSDVCDKKMSPVLKHQNRCWFWAKSVDEEQDVTVVFRVPIKLEAISIVFGHAQHADDTLKNGRLEVARQSDHPGDDGEGKCGLFTLLKHINGDRMLAWKIGEKEAEMSIACLRIVTSKAQKQWILIQDISVKARG